jgi:hypothetical protein
MSPLLFSLVIWDGSVALITGGCLGLEQARTEERLVTEHLHGNLG